MTRVARWSLTAVGWLAFLVCLAIAAVGFAVLLWCFAEALQEVGRR